MGSKEHGNSCLLNSYTTIEGLSYCGNRWGKKMLLVAGAGDHGGVNHDGKPQPSPTGREYKPEQTAQTG